jgi:DNA polymerase-3 subunit gamma/tau
VVGQGFTVRRVKALARRGLAGKAYWISGPSGVGKTTIARLIAAEIADGFNVEELDATGVTRGRLEEIRETIRQSALGSKPGRVYVVNEAHGLRKDIIRELLILLEDIPDHAAWIFTTTLEGQQTLFDGQEDAGPLLSRCLHFELDGYDVDRAFARHVRTIAVREGLDGQPLSAYVELARKSNNNMRAMLQAVEAGQMMARTAAEEKALARRKAREEAAGKAKAVTPGTCPQCGGPVARGKKFCGVQCYFGFLKARKAKRTRKAVA